jgi:phosphoglycerate dehydrogenase-like enzyme
MASGTVKAALWMDPTLFPFVFGPEERTKLAELVDIDLEQSATDIAALTEEERSELDVLITGWGVPQLGTEELGMLPNLKAVVHWGGSVGFLDSSATDRGIVVSSARAANAVPVAEFTIATMILASKDAFWVSRMYSNEQRAVNRELELPDTGFSGINIGIVGASSIGTVVMEMLQSYEVNVLLYHPRATLDRAERLGATLVDDLVELASRSRLFSIHAPDLPETRGMISREVLAALPDGATVINTSRGALVDQDALVEELQAGRIRAVLDVTEPDVLPPGHPIYTLPNVFLTPHLAGSMGNELRRLGASAVSEIERFTRGEPFAHAITP